MKIVHDRNYNFVCSECERPFGKKMHLNYHIKRTHSNPALPESQTKCPDCSRKFTSQEYLNFHRKTRCVHRPIAEVICFNCTAKFPSLIELKNHKVLCLERRQCPRCKHILPRNKFLAHFEICESSHPYKCHKCTKYFKEESVYIKHMQSHNIIYVEITNPEVMNETSSEADTIVQEQEENVEARTGEEREEERDREEDKLTAEDGLELLAELMHTDDASHNMFYHSNDFMDSLFNSAS